MALGQGGGSGLLLLAIGLSRFLSFPKKKAASFSYHPDLIILCIHAFVVPLARKEYHVNSNL